MLELKFIPTGADGMEYGDLILYGTIAALGASVAVIVGLLVFLAFKSYQPPPAEPPAP